MVSGVRATLSIRDSGPTTSKTVLDGREDLIGFVSGIMTVKEQQVTIKKFDGRLPYIAQDP